MIRVGVAGLGMMGLTHLGVYAKRSDTKVVAISDRSPDRLSGAERQRGNISGLAQGAVDFNAVRKYAEASDLIADPDVDLVDICLPTPGHFEYGEMALRAGKHLLVEKPLARTAADAVKFAQAARNANGLAMCAMCMRFWPGWSWLKDAVANRTYGAVKSAIFRRVSSHPGGPNYSDAAISGAAALDLHIHDTDFIQYCFGLPHAVSSRGYSTVTTGVDHLVTSYLYDNGPMVTAEGGWCMARGFPFTMQYTVNFETATAVFDLGQEPPLRLYHSGEAATPQLPSGMGYDHEIAYFVECIQKNRKPTIVTLDDAARSVQIVEAEAESVRSGAPVRLA